MRFQHGLTISLSSFVVLSSAVSHDVMAQTSSTTVAMEEIIVTARKREESLIDIPMSITAISDATIEAGGFNNLQDISLIAPGVRRQSIWDSGG